MFFAKVQYTALFVLPNGTALTHTETSPDGMLGYISGIVSQGGHVVSVTYKKVR